MKLISKTLLYYLLISLPLLVIAGFLSYFVISEELNDAVDEGLKKEVHHVEKAIVKKVQPENLNSNGLYQVDPVRINLVGSSFSDDMKYDSLEREQIKYRVITSYFNYDGQNYKIEISKPTMEEEELMEGLLSAFAVIGFFLILAFFVVNWLLSKTLWVPFYKTLETLSAYELKHHVPENFPNSSTTEFNRLNSALNEMTTKIYTDFIQQKEFTENASHEMQTPLAVIKANVSLLMQSPNMQLEEMNQIQAIDDTTKKMASLNKALLLLAKIDNNQFTETTTLDISEVVNKVLLHLEDLIEAKQLALENHLSDSLLVPMNPVLADILITNLIQNAIRHNSEGGLIKIEVEGNNIIISNTGEPLAISNSDLFIRFKKNEASKDSIGLGLAIVKSICSLYKIEMNHLYQLGLHRFTLKFNVLKEVK